MKHNLYEVSNNRHRFHWTHRRVCLVYFRLNVFIYLLALFFNAAVSLLTGTFFYLLQYGLRFAFSYILQQKMKLFSFLFELHLHKYGGWKENLCACTVQMQNLRFEINKIFFWPFPRTELPVFAWALNDDSKFKVE